jgi:hypothetical protein
MTQAAMWTSAKRLNLQIAEMKTAETQNRFAPRWLGLGYQLSR